MNMHSNLNRRIFLRGLGGAVVAAPFLSSVAERAAKAQGVPATGSPKRLIMMFTHYGCITNYYFPAMSHGPLTAADLTGTTLAGLSPYVNKLLLPRGIAAMNEWTANMARGQGNDPHTQVVGTYFSCQPVTPNSNDPFDFGPPKFSAMPIDRTMDHVAAEQVSPEGVPLFMRVGGFSDTAQSAISYSAGEEPYTGIGSATQVFSTISGLFNSGEPMTPDSYAAIRGKSVIDLVRGDLTTLEGFDMSAADREKLEAWKELLDSTSNMVASAQCNEEMANLLSLNDATFGEIPNAGLGADVITAKVNDTMDVADVFSNLAVLSAACDANRVILMKYPGNHTFTGLGLDMENHNASHRIGDPGMLGKCQPNILANLKIIDEYYAAKFAYLVGQLDSIDEGDGKMLDNCAAVWFQEMSDGNAHNLNNMPIVQVGGCGGYFKTGQAVNVFDGTPDLTAGKSDFLCKDGALDQVDGTTQNTGTDPSIGTAPINKYFCNLMNAIGVKAGPDGYAAVGGTAEVTHFGKYDITQDYIGGGTNPTNISDPGPFEELKVGG